jgi:hypothetical protein
MRKPTERQAGCSGPPRPVRTVTTKGEAKAKCSPKAKGKAKSKAKAKALEDGPPERLVPRKDPAEGEAIAGDILRLPA